MRARRAVASRDIPKANPKALALLGQDAVSLQIAVGPNIGHNIEAIARLFKCPPWSLEAALALADIRADERLPLICR